jgi:hypothetical protein
MKVLAQANKYPFILYLTYKRVAEFNKEDLTLKTKRAKTKLQKISSWEMALQKYLPILFLLYFGKYPSTIEESIVFLITGVYVVGFYMTYNYNKNLFILYALITSSCAYYAMFMMDSKFTIYLNWSVGYAFTHLFLVYLIIDIALKRYQGYYKMLDLRGQHRWQILKRQKRPIIPFNLPFKRRQKGLFWTNMGFNLGFTFFLSGYYVRFIDDKDLLNAYIEMEDMLKEENNEE